ncbi:hypothetical protein GALL_366410 [mine drainage metagenome]|uniref:Uncharacterized protein n=1 Tax=mine drainage metagenome TaxID=410659 RepID=A0A1J5QNR8_9ZZZZ
MQHSQVSFSEFLPTHQDATETIHPTMGAFHHPAPSLEAGFVLNGLRLLAPCADVGGKAEFLHDLAYLVKVIPLVQTKPLWSLCCRVRPLDRDGLQRATDQLHVVSVGTVNGNSNRDAIRFRQQAALDALLAPVRRVRTRFFEPANGAFVIAPSIETQDQSMPRLSSNCSRPSRQMAMKTPATSHPRNRRYAEPQEHIPVADSAFHWQPVRNTNRIAFIASRSGTRGLWHLNGCSLRSGSKGSILSHKLSGNRQPSSFMISPIPPPKVVVLPPLTAKLVPTEIRSKPPCDNSLN